jgi:hypothetical protein
VSQQGTGEAGKGSEVFSFAVAEATGRPDLRRQHNPAGSFHHALTDDPELAQQTG